MSPLLYRALDPFIQVLKPISPLAWMPLALYTIKDSSVSGVFVIFICSVWPMLINTAFGVGAVRRDWLNVANTLEVKPLRKAFQVILPAAAPTILTGMRISMGIAWLVIVAAEMLVGGTGIGYFVWNEWNNLSLTNVIFAILVIGVVGMLLDLAVRAAAEAGHLCRMSVRSLQVQGLDEGLPGRGRQARRRRCSTTSTSASSAASSSASSATRAAARPPSSTCWRASSSPPRGYVFMDGREVAGPSLERGVVFQGHALMPWLSVMQEHRLRGRARAGRTGTRDKVRAHCREASSTWSA